jgi:hypothetical protein
VFETCQQLLVNRGATIMAVPFLIRIAVAILILCGGLMVLSINPSTPMQHLLIILVSGILFAVSIVLAYRAFKK